MGITLMCRNGHVWEYTGSRQQATCSAQNCDSATTVKRGTERYAWSQRKAEASQARPFMAAVPG